MGGINPVGRAIRRFAFGLTIAIGPACVHPAQAGPPYVSDDPEPTDYQHYEIYLFTTGSNAADGTNGESGIDFNYGALPDLQLTAVIPMAYSLPRDTTNAIGFGNVELAAKYRFLHQKEIGWDVAMFPRIFLPSGSSRVGNNQPALLLPLWFEKDWGDWSTFGGGGCQLQHGDDAQTFCLASWAVTRQILPDLQLGIEIVHQTPDTKHGHSSTGVGAGFRYDLSEHYHLLGYYRPGLQARASNARHSWYASLLFTF
jgi:outer membrane putative beta-barrel porin/alpha-amylase